MNTARDGDSTTFLAAIPLPDHSEKKPFLVSNLNLLCYNLQPLPQVLFVAWEKRPNPSSSQPPFRKL